MKLLERQPRESSRDYALRAIKYNIIHLELVPGSQISENELAAELGLSRTPVHEAVSELARVKIIQTCPQKKSVVSPIDYDLVEEARFTRNVLECAVAELNCRMAAPEDILKLRENVRLQHFYLDSFYPDNLMVLDDAFHELLFQIARKSQAYALMQSISIHFDRVRNMALSAVKDLKIVQDHEDIIEAIASKDAAEARRLMELHLSRYQVDAAAIQEKYPQYF